jgi:hypothetical protein
MVVDARSRGQRRRAPLWACLGLAALACLSPKPSGESAPRPAPMSEPPEAPEAAPLVGPSAPAADEAGKAGAPASSPGNPAGGVGAATGQANPKPAERKSKERSAVPRKAAANAISAEPEATIQPAGELRRRLDRAYAASSPDCPSARERKQAVCDLATQICALTDRDPNVASVAEYCEEARRRCSDAERRTSQRCPE